MLDGDIFEVGVQPSCGRLANCSKSVRELAATTGSKLLRAKFRRHGSTMRLRQTSDFAWSFYETPALTTAFFRSWAQAVT